MDEVSKETKGVIEKIFRDVEKVSAAKQLLIGTVSGWCTGFVTMKVGKAAAVALGGGIILLQIANHKGYLKINWEKVHKEVDKFADKVEETATGDGPKFVDKMERMIDRNIEKAEDLLRKNQRKAKRWYHGFIGDEDYFQVQEIHIFLASFVLGFSVGIVTAS